MARHEVRQELSALRHQVVRREVEYVANIVSARIYADAVEHSGADQKESVRLQWVNFAFDHDVCIATDKIIDLIDGMKMAVNLRIDLFVLFMIFQNRNFHCFYPL